MTLPKSCKCLSCKQRFTPDLRNARHQKYCAAPACRKASKTASSRKWLDKPENKNYHRGPLAVKRVQDWQSQHADYRVRQKEKRAVALQDVLIAQAIDSKEKNAEFPTQQETPKNADSDALQDVLTTHPALIIGLLGHFFELTLQDDIAKAIQKLQKLGTDITNGRCSNEPIKTSDLPRANTHSAKAVQLDRPASSAGAPP